MKITPLKQLVIILLLLAFAGMFLRGWIYVAGQKLDAEAREQELVMNRLFQMGKDNYLMRSMSLGKNDDARQLLSFEMANDIKEIRVWLASTDEGWRHLAQINCARLLLDEHTHPDYYLTAQPKARMEETEAWAAAQSNLTADTSK